MHSHIVTVSAETFTAMYSRNRLLPARAKVFSCIRCLRMHSSANESEAVRMPWMVCLVASGSCTSPGQSKAKTKRYRKVLSMASYSSFFPFPDRSTVRVQTIIQLCLLMKSPHQSLSLLRVNIVENSLQTNMRHAIAYFYNSLASAASKVFIN